MRTPVIAAILFLVLSSIAMFLYPGGSIFSPNSTNFSLATNFFSDLGTGGYTGRPVLPIVNILFYISMMAAAVGFASFFAQFGKTNKTAAIFGWLSAFSIVVLLFLPSDKFLWPHRIAAVSIVVFLLIACWSLYLGFRKNTPARKGLFAYSILLSLYVGWLFFGPLPDASLQANIIHAFSQKIIVYGFTAVVFLFALSTDSATKV